MRAQSWPPYGAREGSSKGRRPPPAPREAGEWGLLWGPTDARAFRVLAYQHALVASGAPRRGVLVSGGIGARSQPS